MNSNAEFDLASRREEERRAAAVGAAHAVVSAKGSADCVDCGSAIPAKRLIVAPFAVRCLDCQKIHENEKYHR